MRLPLPVLHGERVGVRGFLHERDSWRVPLTRRFAPTSPRKRGEAKKNEVGDMATMTAVARPLLPLPACGERVGVRGFLRGRNAWKAPLTRRFAPTSPRRRGEVHRTRVSGDGIEE